MSRRSRTCHVCGARLSPKKTRRPAADPLTANQVLTHRPDLSHMTTVGARLAEAHLESA